MPTPLLNTSQPIAGGRVTTLTLDTKKPVAAVDILSGPQHGNATVNPDNSIALVLSGSSHAGPDAMQYRITYADGSTETRDASWTVTAPVQDAGWGQGKHYMLAEDAAGDVIVETGEVHRKVHVSESANALSLGDIAAREGLAKSAITKDWLMANGQYGATEGMALDTEAAMMLWRGLTSPHLDQPVSHWLLFERGYTYDPGRLVTAKLQGESALHPVHITSWGDGDRPVITPRQYIYQHDNSRDIVFSDLTFTGGILSLNGENILFHDMLFTGEGLNIQDGAGYTLHDSEVTHVVNDPPPGAQYWSGTKAGLFSRAVDGWLIEGTIFHHNGWEDNYRADWSTAGGMPPNILSHNVYLQNDTTDVTFRDNITAEGASFGAHIRGGGFVEDNIFLDNNNAVDLLGGAYSGAGPIGNFTFFADNVITSGAHKETDRFDGGLTRGVTNSAYDTTLLGNIIAHLADPNNPADAAGKWFTNYALYNEHGAFFDDTVIYNWIGNDPNRREIPRGDIDDRNTQNVDPALADQTTIQNFAAALMGTKTGTIRGLMDHLVAQAETAQDDAVTAADIVAYFQAGFGIGAMGTGQTSHRFVPDERGDGVRWDNRINWDSDELPDTGDSVDLGGNWVQYGGTTTLTDLDFGSGGWLSVNYGRLTVTGTLDAGTAGARLGVEGAGQFWTDGYADADRTTFDIAGGRFANTGAFTGLATIGVSGQAQAILATDNAQMVLGAGSILSMTGSAVDAGFDGDGTGTARLAMQDGATLRFVADQAGVSTIGEFRSGSWDQAGIPVQSEMRVDGRLEVDLSSYSGGSGTLTLIDVDRLDGTFDDIAVTGLSARLDARLTLDYGTDQLTLDLTPGSGSVSYGNISHGSVSQAVDPGPATQPNNNVDPSGQQGVQQPQPQPDPATGPDPDPVDPTQGGAADYRVTMLDDPAYSAGYQNVVGVYTLDENGLVNDPRILFGNAKTQKGDSVLLDVDAGHDLHFFLVQNAAPAVAALAATDDLSLKSGAGGYELYVNGAEVDWIVFYSEAASRNPDGLEHFRYGPADDTGLRVLGVEDLLGGGDLDYNDVGLGIQQISGL